MNRRHLAFAAAFSLTAGWSLGEVHRIRMVGQVSGIQSINGDLEGHVRLNDPYVLVVSYNTGAAVDHSGSSGDAREDIDLSVSLFPVYIDSPSWLAQFTNTPEAALFIENNSLATTGVSHDSLRARVTKTTGLGASFPTDSEDTEPEFGTMEVEFAGSFISDLTRLPTTVEVLQFLDSATAEVSLHGDYLVRFSFERETATSSVEGAATTPITPSLEILNLFQSGQNHFLKVGATTSQAGTGYRLETSDNLQDWTPVHLFIGTGAALSTNFSFRGPFLRLVDNGQEIEGLLEEERPRE